MKEIKNRNGKGTGVYICTRRVVINGKTVTEKYLYQPQVSKSHGRKRFGRRTAKSYNERPSRNSFNHYSERANENGWNAMNRK